MAQPPEETEQAAGVNFWTIKGIGPEERNAATTAADRAGQTIEEWLARAIRAQIQADHQANRASSVVDQQVPKSSPSETSSSKRADNSEKPPYGNFSWRGVPYNKIDIEYAVEKIRTYILNMAKTQTLPCRPF